MSIISYLHNLQKNHLGLKFSLLDLEEFQFRLQNILQIYFHFTWKEENSNLLIYFPNGPMSLGWSHELGLLSAPVTGTQGLEPPSANSQHTH